MTKPHWQKLHDWWTQDFTNLVQERWFFIKLLRKYPGDERFINTVKGIEKALEAHQKEYKKSYGTRFRIGGIKKDIEQ